MDTDTLLITIVLAVGLLEGVLSWRWARLYYRSGVPIYRHRRPYLGFGEMGGLDSVLTQQLRSSSTSSIVVKRVGDGEFAFREPMFERGFRFRYTPIMHGHIEFVSTERALTVTGRLNWSTLAIVCYVAYSIRSAWHESMAVFIGIFLVFLAICYLVQLARYRAVAKAVQLALGGGT